MAKQIIEIEVPKGKKAVWKNNRVVFENIDNMENIKTIDDAILFLIKNKIGNDILNTLSKLLPNSFEWKVAAYRAVVMAITNNEERHLTTGRRYFPVVELCQPKKHNKCFGDIIIGQIKSGGEVFDVVGGSTLSGTLAGLSGFCSGDGISYNSANVGFWSVGSNKAALYISKNFGKLLFEIIYGGTNCNWKWVSEKDT